MKIVFDRNAKIWLMNEMLFPCLDFNFVSTSMRCDLNAILKGNNLKCRTYLLCDCIIQNTSIKLFVKKR